MTLNTDHPFAPWVRVHLDESDTFLSFVQEVDLRERTYRRTPLDLPEETGTFHHLSISEGTPEDTRILMEQLLSAYLVGV